MALVALFVSSALSGAGTWSGVLVDSRCYESEERNVNPTDTMIYVDRDTNLEIAYCAPNAKTKAFALVQPDGLSFKLDSDGNAKAVELVRRTAKRRRFSVTITGETNKGTLKVDSISMAR